MADLPTSDEPTVDGDRPSAGSPDGAPPAVPDRVVREVELPTTTDAVWGALTDAAEVAAWFGAELTWELRPGGPIRVGEGDDGSSPRRGEVDEVAPGRRLRFRWWPSDGRDDGHDQGASVVTYDLEPVPGGTRLVVTEAPLAPTTVPAAASAAVAWDTRLVGLWLGCRAGSLVRA